MTALLAHDRFAQQLNTQFRIEGPRHDQVTLELVETRQGPINGRYESFALIFRGPAATILPQAIYRLDHVTCGSLDLFIVPIARDGAGTYYEAAFSRLRGEGEQ